LGGRKAALEAVTETANQVLLVVEKVANLERGGRLERVKPTSFVGNTL
jgi:fatty acid-binding protein DegV